MKITKEWLTEKLACDEGIHWFLNQKETDDLKVLEALKEGNKIPWANWLICRLMDKPNQVRYAIFAARCVLDIFEKKYPKDDRPRKAIEAAQAWLNNPNDKTAAAAHAAHAAYDAADAAAAHAAYAAYAAAHAAHAAAAAHAAYDAADDAADYAAAAAAYDAYDAADYDAADYDAADYDAYARKMMQIKILDYGIGLLRKRAK